MSRPQRAFKLRIGVTAAATATGLVMMCLGLAPGGQTVAAAASSSAPTEVDSLMEAEADLVEVIRNLSVQRDSSVTKSGKTTNYEITASARGTEGFAYYKHWTCSKSWWTPRGCSNFEDRRSEFFAAALAKHREVRAEILSEFYVFYGLHKNVLDPYLGKPFMLVNNRTTQIGAADPTAASRCLDVSGDPGTLPGVGLELFDCQVDRATSGGLPTDQVWSFVPGTGQLRNRLSGRCLDVSGSPEGTVGGIDGTKVVLQECDTTGDPAHAGQQWGLNPLGYLVNLSSGLCLDMSGAIDAVSNGTGARVANCEFGLSPAPNSLGSSLGIRAGDKSTTQSWSMLYLKGGMDTFLPAPIPPLTTIDSGPSGTVSPRESAIFAFSSRLPGATFECNEDNGGFEPCASPLAFPHEGFSLPKTHTFTVRAISSDGVVDPRGATRVWTVAKRELF